MIFAENVEARGGLKEAMRPSGGCGAAGKPLADTPLCLHTNPAPSGTN